MDSKKWGALLLVAELSGAQEKRLCIGTFASISTQWLAKVLGRFQEKFPDTELELRGRAENVALLPLAEPLYRRLGMNRPAGVPEGHALHTLLSLLRADLPAPADYPRKK